MLAHIVNAAVRALAASIVLGGMLIYAAGGFDSPNIRPLGGVIVLGFFIFWIVFVFMFGTRVPKPDHQRQDGYLDEASHLMSRGRRRRESHDHGNGSVGGEGTDGGGGGGGD